MKLESERQAARLLGSLRRRARITRAQLAKRLNVSVSTINRRDRGDIGLHVDALVATAHQLGYDVVLIRREQP